MKLRKISKKITVFSLSCVLLAGCANLAFADEDIAAEAEGATQETLSLETETVPEPDAAPEQEMVQEAEPEATPEPEPTPAPEPEPVPAPEPEATPEPEITQEPEADQGITGKPETDAGSETEQKTGSGQATEQTSSAQDTQNHKTQEEAVSGTREKASDKPAAVSKTTSYKTTTAQSGKTAVVNAAGIPAVYKAGEIKKDTTGTIEAAKEEAVEEEASDVYKQGVYVALRNAGMAHNGAVSVMAVMDTVGEFQTSDDGLLGWKNEWKDALDEFSDGETSSYIYQIAFLLDTIESPEEDGSFNDLKAVLMSDSETTTTDVWYFTHSYVDVVNPDNEADIQDAFDLATEYANKYEDIKDTYEELTSIFDMAQAVNGQAVADYACRFVGNPYVWGGTSLTNGCDCSGFIMSVYANFGVSLPHYSGSLRYVGYEVAASEMLPGDIVCYDGHCAIYIGDGRIVHASNSKPYPAGGIKISDNYNYRTVLAIRRVFEPDKIDIEPAVLTK